MANENPFEDPFADANEGKEEKDTQHFSDYQPVNQYQGIPGTPAHVYQVPIPDSTTVLVLGILSIIGSLCYGIVGLVLGIIGMALSARAERRYQETKERYQATSYSTLKAGRICSLIGLILSIVLIIVYLLYFVWIFSELNHYRF